jgi:hypothetical protein
VVKAAAYDRFRSRYDPGEVVLVVEVVNPGPESQDRREKPAGGVFTAGDEVAAPGLPWAAAGVAELGE